MNFLFRRLEGERCSRCRGTQLRTVHERTGHVAGTHADRRTRDHLWKTGRKKSRPICNLSTVRDISDRIYWMENSSSLMVWISSEARGSNLMRSSMMGYSRTV